MPTWFYILVGFLVLITAMYLLSYYQTKKASVKLDEEKFKINMRKSQLIDVRSKNEFDSGHINGARNIPIGIISKQYKKLRSDQPIYLYCASGKRSSRAAVYLRSKGYTDLFELDNGLKGWTGNLK